MKLRGLVLGSMIGKEGSLCSHRRVFFPDQHFGERQEETRRRQNSSHDPLYPPLQSFSGCDSVLSGGMCGSRLGWPKVPSATYYTSNIVSANGTHTLTTERELCRAWNRGCGLFSNKANYESNTTSSATFGKLSLLLRPFRKRRGTAAWQLRYEFDKLNYEGECW